MQLPDLINGTFELGGAFAVWLSIRRTHRDRVVRSVSWPTNAFFTSWGAWNLLYYPHLDQWASFAGAVALVASNAVWLAMLVYYTRREARPAVFRADDGMWYRRGVYPNLAGPFLTEAGARRGI